MGVCVLLGSKSDFDKAMKALEVFKELGIDFEVHVASAHRTPKLVEEMVMNTSHEVFLVFAGLSAALPGFVASLTTKPVVGVPISGKVPLDSLLSMVQMPKGVPVAVVGVDNAINGALLCAELLALKNKSLTSKIEAYREKMRKKVLEDDKEVQEHVQAG